MKEILIKIKNIVKDLFTPNKIVNNNIMMFTIGVQLCLLMIFWIYGTGDLIPKPMGILQAFKKLVVEENLTRELWTTLSMCLHALISTFIISLLVSYATIMPFFKPIGLLITKFRFLTLVGLSFIFTLITSSGYELKVFILVFGMTVFFVTSMLDVLKNISNIEFNHARTLSLSEWRVTYEVIILARVYDVLIVAKQNFAMAWLTVSLVEGLVRSDGGVGTLLLNNNKHFNLDAVFAIQITIILFGILIDFGFAKLIEVACPHINTSNKK